VPSSTNDDNGSGTRRPKGLDNQAGEGASFHRAVRGKSSHDRTSDDIWHFNVFLAILKQSRSHHTLYPLTVATNTPTNHNGIYQTHHVSTLFGSASYSPHVVTQLTAFRYSPRNVTLLSLFSFAGGYLTLKSRTLAEKQRIRANGDYSVTVDRSGMSLYRVHYTTIKSYTHLIATCIGMLSAHSASVVAEA
jgi:hypothetical protein